MKLRPVVEEENKRLEIERKIMLGRAKGYAAPEGIVEAYTARYEELKASGDTEAVKRFEEEAMQPLKRGEAERKNAELQVRRIARKLKRGA